MKFYYCSLTKGSLGGYLIITVFLLLTVINVPRVVAAESAQVTLWREQLKASEDLLKILNKQTADVEKLVASYKNNPSLKANPAAQKGLEQTDLLLELKRTAEKNAESAIADLRKKIDESGASIAKDTKGEKEAVKQLGFVRKLRSFISRIWNLF